MKRRFAKASLKHLVFIILVLLTYNVNAQEDANNHNQPYMWSKNEPRMIRHFINRKLPLINKKTGISQPDNFTLGNFLGMIKYFKDHYYDPLHQSPDTFAYLHVYIAAYSNDGTSIYVPAGLGNHLTLLFAPASEKDDLDYFNIPPGISFNEKDIDKFKIDKTQHSKLSQEWMDNYIDNAMQAILKTIDTNLKDNRIKRGSEASDTRCITYCKNDILELVDEQTFAHTKHSNTIDFSTSMRASFAAFGSKGNTRHQKKGKKRLFVQFDFLDKDNTNKIIYLEQTDGFGGRKPSIGGSCRYSQIVDDKNAILSTDNGQLCPPCTNCPPDYPGCQ